MTAWLTPNTWAWQTRCEVYRYNAETRAWANAGPLRIFALNVRDGDALYWPQDGEDHMLMLRSERFLVAMRPDSGHDLLQNFLAWALSQEALGATFSHVTARVYTPGPNVIAFEDAGPRP